MKIINQSIPNAFAAIQAKVAKDGKNVPKEFAGYAASFGAAVRTAGLLNTVVFFEGSGDKKKFNDALLYMLEQGKGERTTLVHAVLQKIDPTCDPTDTQYDFTQFRGNATNEKILKETLINYSIALKLAVRLFEKS